MTRTTLALTAGLALAATAVAQDLPPDVLLLSRVQRHVREELQRLPNISCVETVQREYQPAKGKMRPLDTVRLEVISGGDKELFASPGDREFSEQAPISYAGSGVLGSGLFGPYLKNILVSGNVSTKYMGEEEIGGRRVARWDYRLPVMWSGETIQTPEGSGAVGLRGSYWADPQAYDVVRLELNAAEIPPQLPIAEAVTTINYARTTLSNNTVALLPESAEFRLVKFSGEISHNRIEFTQCRVFEAHSTLSSGPPDSAGRMPRSGPPVAGYAPQSLPAGLRIAVNLRARISADMAVGALIDGVVADNVLSKGAVAIAAGSPVRGRIRRLERYTDPFLHFVVGLEFTEVELHGIWSRFYADVEEIQPVPGVAQTLEIRGRGATEKISLYNLPGVATFFFTGGELDLPRGFRTVWKTLPLAP